MHGPQGQDKTSQEGPEAEPEPVHLSKNTRTVERLLKPTRYRGTLCHFQAVCFRWAQHYSARDLARHAMPVHPARPLLRRAVPVLTVVTTDADARRGHAGYGTYSPPTGVAGPMYARATELSAPRRPLGLSSLDISYPLFRQQARCRCRRPGRRVRVVLQLLAERVNGHSTPSTLARSAPRPRRRSEKR